MKTLLAKFYKSLACRVAWALVATTTVASAHDLPQHFSLAPTDWGMIQQDCMGHQNHDKFAIDSDVLARRLLVEIAVALPDPGNPPQPQAACGSEFVATSSELVGADLYDRVDCAQLESFYRNSPSDDLVEQSSTESSQIATIPAPSVEPDLEFHKSLLAACSCEFENIQANQSIAPPTFVLKRTYVEDYFATEYNSLKPLVLRDLSGFRLDDDSPLAVAQPTQELQNKYLVADALSQLESWDCVARSEFYSLHRAHQLGELASFLANTWFNDALPSASQAISEFAQNLTPARNTIAMQPMFILFTTASGNEVAVPIAQARNWQQPVTNATGVSEELQLLIDSANARLQWAGGRMSAAASYMNDWFSDRVTRAKSIDLR